MANVERYVSFTSWVLQIDPTRLVFVDEAHFVSRKLHRQKAVGPIGSKTFVVRKSSIQGDDDVTLSIGTSLTSPSPVWGATTVGPNDAWNFYQFICQMVLSGFLCAGKVLILDNARIHRSGAYLPQLMELLEEVNVTLRFQPAYSPEFNAWSSFFLGHFFSKIAKETATSPPNPPLKKNKMQRAMFRIFKGQAQIFTGRGNPGGQHSNLPFRSGDRDDEEVVPKSNFWRA